MKFIFLLLFSSSAFATGGVVNKGGDTVRCLRSAFGLEGYYTLDYALAIGRGASPQDFAEVHNWEDSRTRLIEILLKVDPNLAASFADFARSTAQIQPLSVPARSRRQWVPHRGAPLRVEDVGDISQLPQACKYKYKAGLHSRFSVYRVIRRSMQANQFIKYRYDQRRLAHLRTPMQRSFLLVHEWLWDWTADVEVNRQVNAFLHSKRIGEMSPADIGAELKRLGM